MEMLVIVLVVLLALAGVLVPLFRRHSGAADAREFAVDADPVSARSVNREEPVAMPEDHIEREVLRYRAAVRAGTACRKCGQANPADARFCYECGTALPLADAKEFA